MIKYHRLSGKNARLFIDDIARLRLQVFWDFPYLYDGSFEYEKKYLETYFQAAHSFIFLIEDQGQIVGATTGIWAMEEEASFREPFKNFGLDPQKIFYLGESLLLPQYRGQGFGKLFFSERENYAKGLPFIEYLSFCAVVRADDHPLKPKDYRPLDDFWRNMGFDRINGLTTVYEWKDRNESITTKKTMQFWLKNLKG